MTICDMTPDDVKEVAGIEKEIFSTPWSEKSFADSISSNDNIYVVAKEEGKIIGYVGIWIVADEGQINNVAVRKEFRNKGVCGKLLEFAMDKAKEKKVSAFTLEVRAGNAAAIHLYEKIGFVNSGTRKNYYKKPDEDAIIMWLT